MTDRLEFSKAVKRQAFKRAGGACELCGGTLSKGVEYHHVNEAFLGGGNRLRDCQVLCKPCHALVTRKRRPEIDKTRRLADRQMGIKPKRKPLTNPKWKRKLDGTTVPR